MKKTFLAVATLAFTAMTSMAQTNSLAALGSLNYTVDEGSSTASYSQTTTNLTLFSPFGLGNTLGGVFSTAYDWSAYSNTNNFTFGLLMSAPEASPDIPFTVEFFNAELTAIVGAYTGDATGLGTSPTFITMSLQAGGNLSSIGGMQFTWDGTAGAGTTVVVDSVAVVPEPTTWAMLVFGGVLFGGLALRRRLAAVRL
jgi:hypothetical protein